jgi:hypothetical protein
MVQYEMVSSIIDVHWSNKRLPPPAIGFREEYPSPRKPKRIKGNWSAE